ncbi:MAG TPA: MFS transporter [Urbifossiella sp.]|nr:MFS transporter [Urbifossiella sp.]
MTPNPHPSWRWLVCGVLLLATCLNYMDRQAFSETATELKRVYNLDDQRYGWIEEGFSLGFAAGALVFGFLADRLGPRRLYPVVLVGWSIAGIVTPLAADPNFTAHLQSPGDAEGAGPFRWFLICRTVLGFFESGHWPCALITARQVLAVKDRTFGNAILQSGASLGAILTPLYVLYLRRWTGGGWGLPFWTIGAGGLLWVPLWLALVPRGSLSNAPPPPTEGAAWPGYFTVFRRFIVLAIVVSCLGVSWQFIRAWLPKYLKEFQHYEPEVSARAVMLYYIAADVGCLLAGYLVKKLTTGGLGVHASRILIYVGWAGLTAIAAVIPFLGGDPWVLVPAFMLVGAGILGLHPVYYALAQELPARRMGTLSGMLSATTWAVVAMVQGAIGTHIKNTGDYSFGFYLAGLAPLIGLAALLLLWKPAREANAGPRTQ